MNRLIELYPRAWRDRYEVEFLGVMEARMPSLGDRVDVVRGAIDARLHPQVAATGPGDPAPARSARLGGVLAVVGGALWAAAGIAFNSSLVNPSLGYKESDSAVVIAIAAAFLTGLAALAASRSLPGRPGLLSISAIAVLVGAFLMAFPWPVVFLGFSITLIGTVMFGLMAFGFLASSRFGPMGVPLAGAAMLAFGFNTEDARALLLVPLGAAWILLGIALATRRASAKVGSLPKDT